MDSQFQSMARARLNAKVQLKFRGEIRLNFRDLGGFTGLVFHGTKWGLHSLALFRGQRVDL